MSARIVALLAAFAISGTAQQWPQWRGPNRDGVAASFPAPEAWPEKLSRKWKVEIGEGHSSPVVSDGKVYIHSRQGEREVVSCLRIENGQAIWRESYAAPYSVIAVAASHGKGVKSTPVVADGRICTLGIGGILSCFDGQTGKPLWRKQFEAPLYGTAMSPLIDRGLVIAHVEQKSGGMLASFDAQSGAERWSWKGDGASYASPVVLELAGTRQVVTQSRTRIVSLDAATGALLWGMPFSTDYDQNAVTPAVYRDLLIFSGLRNGILAVRVGKRGSGLVPETVWHNRDLSMYMSSPVVMGDVMFGLTNRNSGQFFAMDPRTGTVLWTSAGRQGENAALIGAGSRLLALTTDATLTVANANSRAYEPVRKYSVAASPTWAHPAMVKNGVLVKDATSLALWEVR